MIIACWSVKGGSGTTVVAASLAVAASRAAQNGVLLVDLAGDVPAVLGIDDQSPQGVLDWIQELAVGGGTRTGSAGLPGAIAALEVRVDDQLSVLPWGSASGQGVPLHAIDPLLARLRADGRLVIVDAGTILPSSEDGVRHRFVRQANRSVLVTRSCYLALRHAARVSLKADSVVLISEAGRSLGATDVASVTGSPVVAELKCEPQMARLVDAGLLASRIPRSVERSLLPVWDH